MVKKRSKKPAHSITGASSMHRWEPCPGSPRESAKYPNTESPYAKEGTLAHKVAETVLGVPIGERDLAIDQLRSEHGDELVNAVLVYVDYVEDLFDRAQVHVDSFRKVEFKFHCPEIHENYYGTADCVIWNANTKTLHVVDYKHGVGVPVAAEENEQLLYYALGVIYSLKVKPKKIAASIVQPRTEFGEPIQTWEFHPIELIDFEPRVVQAIIRTEDPDAPLVPGVDQCRFCNAKPKCPAVKKLAEETALTTFSPVEAYDPNDLAQVLSKLPILESWVKSVKAFALAEAMRGRLPAGWKLVAGRKTRSWTSEEAAVKVLKKDFKLSEGDLYEVALKSPAQVEKLLNTKQKGLLNVVVKSHHGYTLAPESDKRPAVDLSPENVFDAIDTDAEIFGSDD